ncbi:hypothetical protein P9D43_29195 [Neobacillus niacini]|uniref:hypothetical protein n=1 Tax=Neobacillus niacini TaxID=86668 RepID=UPI0007ABD158|nr:hypothetical protein [Neobacillus niacini]MEC1526072.1 hypothetical protein [Neobacillus niacini]
MLCKYCKSEMMGQDNDHMGNGRYSKYYGCTKCEGVYEEWTDKKGKFMFGKWWNPETKDYDGGSPFAE